MSGKKPPPRPPLPKGQSPSKLGKGGGANTPGRLRSALASISIRYNPALTASQDSDSEEEICIVREEENLCDSPGEGKRVSHQIDENTQVTHVATNELERSKQSVLATGSNVPLLKLSTESLNGVENGNSEKRTIVKENTGNSKINSGVENENSSRAKGMRFLRRDQGPCKNEQTKTNDQKDEVDSGSQPSKSHLSLHVDRGRNGQKDETRAPRSPSPFRRLYKGAHNDSASQSAPATGKSAISLSSLLAAAEATEDKSEDSVNNEGSEDLEVFEDAVPDISTVPTSIQFEIANLEPPPTPSTPKHDPPFTFLLSCVLFVYIYMISNLPVFMNGMIVGSAIAYLVGCLVLLVVCPEDSINERFQRELKEYNLRISATPKPTYESVDPGLLLRPREMKGWMLKAYNYDPSSISETSLVYARLKDNKLILSHPKPDASTKKLDIKTVNDSTNLPFTRHDHFNLTGSKICLTPLTMSPRRIWSKKYPLCLFLGQAGEVREEVKPKDDEDESSQHLLPRVKSQRSRDDVSVLYLFAKTGRQKEEWYQNFDRILKPKKTDTVSDIDYLLHPTSCSYPHYMAKLLPNPDTGNKESQEVQLAWVNMLFGRVFWDVWQDRYWADKIKQRFQNKLSRVQKPQFIRDIHITDLTLGHTFPLINGVSPPVLDELGMWVDFDVTYSGGIVFTLETHLNIDGYLNHFINLGKENKDISEDLNMEELSRKYEMLEKEEHVQDPIVDDGDDDDDQSLTSESPPESDSDFESPESEFEELTSKFPDSRPTSSENELLSPTDVASGNSYAQEALMQLESLEGFLEKEIAEAESMHLDVGAASSLSLSRESLSNAESISDSGRNSPFQKQSSSEESSCLSPPTSPTIHVHESPSASPVKKRAVRAPQGGTRKKLFGVLERLAKSKWVKKAAETKIVKTAAEKFSNLPIILSVEVQNVKGTLTLNIPPPPTNRLWYGFRDDPMLFVTARPKLGGRQVRLTHVTDWIEKKLKQEFKNMFVLPNMEDIPIKIMNSDVEKQFSDN